MRSVILMWFVGVSAWDKAIENESEGHITNIHVVFRHGHREPKTSYPNDTNAESKVWQNGPGQLTILGRQQAYKLGVELRNRYSSLIPKERAWKVIRTESSDVRRTIMTATTVLSGLAPPGSEDMWSDLAWQPVDVHSISPSVDNYLSASPQCQRYQDKKRQIIRTPTKETTSLYEYIGAKIGKKINNRIFMLNLYTCLQIQKDAGLELPSWTEPVFKDMKEEARKILLQTSESLELKRLKSGPFIKKLISNTYTRDYYPIRLYATHDTVISGLIGSLGMNVSDFPGFTATLIFEHRKVSSDHFLQIWWSPDSNSELKRISIARCSEKCPLNKVIELTSPVIPLNWELECNDLTIKELLVFDGSDDAQLWFPSFIVLCALMICVFYFAVISFRSSDYQVMIGKNVVGLND